VFTGGWTLASAEAVCDPGALGLDPLDAMASLVDQSLVTRARAATGDPRFSMVETIREFGREQLAATGELEALARRHAEHYLASPWPPSPTSPAPGRPSGWTAATRSTPTSAPPCAGPSRPARPTGLRRRRGRSGGSGSSAGT
jgi:hypothetical protein